MKNKEESEKRPNLIQRVIAAIKGESIEEFTFLDVSDIQPKDYLRVHQVSDDSDSLAEALGISPERFQELQKIAHAAYVSTNKLSAAMAVGSESVKHANELAMLGYLLGDIRERSNHPLISILGGMRKP
jgi:hypothetical protein